MQHMEIGKTKKECIHNLYNIYHARHIYGFILNNAIFTQIYIAKTIIVHLEKNRQRHVSCQLQKTPGPQTCRKTRSAVLCCVAKCSLAASGWQDVRGRGCGGCQLFTTSRYSEQAVCNTLHPE